MKAISEPSCSFNLSTGGFDGLATGSGKGSGKAVEGAIADEFDSVARE
jgi:hypothetical protein